MLISVAYFDGNHTLVKKFNVVLSKKNKKRHTKK